MRNGEKNAFFCRQIFRFLLFALELFCLMAKWWMGTTKKKKPVRRNNNAMMSDREAKNLFYCNRNNHRNMDWILFVALRVFDVFGIQIRHIWREWETEKSINGRQWAPDLYTLIKCIPYLGMGFRLGLTLRRSNRSDLEKWLHSWFHSKIQQHNIFHPLNFHGAKVWIENTRSHYSFWSNWGRRLPESTEKKAEEEEIIKSDIYSMPSHHPLRNPMLNRWLNAF